MDRENSHMAPIKRENYVERKKTVTIKLSDKQYVNFRRDRVNKLRELYEKCIPEVEKKVGSASRGNRRKKGYYNREGYWGRY